MVLDRFNTMYTGKFNTDELDQLKKRLDTLDELSDLAESIQSIKITDNETPIKPHDVLIVEFFPFYKPDEKSNFDDSTTDDIETEDNFPTELSFHKKLAPSVPKHSTSTYYSPSCCFCNAKVIFWPFTKNKDLNSISAILLSIDLSWPG